MICPNNIIRDEANHCILAKSTIAESSSLPRVDFLPELSELLLMVAITDTMLVLV